MWGVVARAGVGAGAGDGSGVQVWIRLGIFGFPVFLLVLPFSGRERMAGYMLLYFYGRGDGAFKVA